MRIGIITDAIDDKAGGIQTYVRHLVKELIAKDPANEYVLIHHSKLDDPFYQLAKEIIIPIPRVPFGREIRKLLMPHTLAKYDLDVLHETAQIGPWFLPCESKKIVTVHDLTALVYPQGHTLLTWLHHKLLMKHSLRRADTILAASENTKRDIIHFFNIPASKIQVTHEGYHESFRPLPERSLKEVKEKYHLHEPFILSVGTLEPRKNYERLLHAYARSGLNERLVIVGRRGWKYERIFTLLKELDLQERVTILDNVPFKNIPHIMNLCTFFIYPSLYEGFGLPPLEAMACGKAVITSNVSSLPEVVGESALLIDPNDTPQITEALKKLAQDPSQRKELERKGREQAKKFSWTQCAQATLEAYNS